MFIFWIEALVAVLLKVVVLSSDGERGGGGDEIRLRRVE
ncbi:unnamed protein product [Rotaria magnacalcarata]|uniref:Uncharacterized protein n=1 Tax=Rotaria magnacalcarata TaxID=392030 RepID=A0A8S3CZA9_9BILA|nr:unnamed protein product [Rotaria magnacalcarata]